MRFQTEAIEGPGRSLFWDDGELDHYRYRDEDGNWHTRPVAATEEEKREAEAGALTRELAGIEHKLAHLDDEVMPWQAIPNPAEVERTRSSLENTKQAVLARLAELGQPAAEDAPAKTKRRLVKR